MVSKYYILPLCLLVLSCIHLDPTENGFQVRERIACEIIRDNPSGLPWNDPKEIVYNEDVEVSFITDIAEEDHLPKVLSCRGRQLTINDEGYGSFLNALEISDDGKRAVIYGGIQLAPLYGQGWGCLLQKVRGSWINKGCQTSYVS